MNEKPRLARSTSIVRKAFFAAWLVVIVSGLGYFAVYPQSFSAENIARFLERFQNAIWAAYLVMSVLRGFTLLPSSPLVIAGTLLFPAQPFLVLAVSMVGILTSSALIYFFSEYLGFNEYFEDHKPELTHKIRSRLDHPTGVLFVAVWAFFPLVPTDLVCYVAGTTKMNFFKFIAAIFAGELVLCSLYIFLGGAALNHLR